MNVLLAIEDEIKRKEKDGRVQFLILGCQLHDQFDEQMKHNKGITYCLGNRKLSSYNAICIIKDNRIPYRVEAIV